MPEITFVFPDGTRRKVAARTGQTVMEVAAAHHIEEIEAECGGGCSCATCHVYVDADWEERTGPPSAEEEDMLDFAWDVKSTSRLSCQITITDDLDGLIVHLPQRQG